MTPERGIPNPPPPVPTAPLSVLSVAWAVSRKREPNSVGPCSPSKRSRKQLWGHPKGPDSRRPNKLFALPEAASLCDGDDRHQESDLAKQGPSTEILVAPFADPVCGERRASARREYPARHSPRSPAWRRRTPRLPPSRCARGALGVRGCSLGRPVPGLRDRTRHDRRQFTQAPRLLPQDLRELFCVPGDRCRKKAAPPHAHSGSASCQIRHWSLAPRQALTYRKPHDHRKTR